MRIVEWGTSAKGNGTIFTSLHTDFTDRGNWTTVLTGENGTKKSLMLRGLLDGSLQVGYRRTANYPAFQSIVTTIPEHASPSAVIAISGTPFDRFPARPIKGRTTQANTYARSQIYTYLGLKTSNGAFAAAQSLRTIAYIMLESIGIREAGWSCASLVMSFLRLQSEVKIELRRGSSLNTSARVGMPKRNVGQLDDEKARKFVEDAAKRFPHLTDDTDFQRLMGSPIDVAFLLKRLRDLPASIVFDFTKNAIPYENRVGSFNIKEVLFLLDAGVISIEKILVKRSTEAEFINAEADLSSGQWHVFYTLVGLALSATDNSIILIDEPENSLHPDWQRQYVDLLSKVLTGRNCCHTVIATHSPLIASGVEEGTGNVVRLVPYSDGPLGIAAAPEALTFGWDVGDVYRQTFGMESTRALSFVEKADRALELVADSDENSEEFKGLVRELSQTAQSLPERDTMRTVINSIAKIADGGQ